MRLNARTAKLQREEEEDGLPVSPSTDSQVRAGLVLEGKYNLTRELGAGGMGQVFLARHETLERQVAIKVLHRNLAGDESVRRRFETEAKAIARLRHPNCVMLYEFGYSEEIEALFAVFEYVEGESLEAFIGTQLPINDVLELGKQVAQGIAHAHDQKIIHRDLKPENIMVVAGADSDRVEVKVLDFGIARIAEDDEKRTRLTQMGQMFGTPPYMSPEQIRAKLNVTFATDIYSIGIILYEMLEGRLPFLGDTPIETVMMHLHDDVPPMVREGVPDGLLDIVRCCLEKEADDRFASCKELYLALEGVEWEPNTVSLLGGMAPDGSAESIALKPTATPDEVIRTEDFDDGSESEEAAEPQGQDSENSAFATAATMLPSEDEEPVISGEPLPAVSKEPEPAAKIPSATTQDLDDSGRVGTIAPLRVDGKQKMIAAAIVVVLLAIVGGLAMVLSGGDEEEVDGVDERVAADENQDDEADDQGVDDPAQDDQIAADFDGDNEEEPAEEESAEEEEAESEEEEPQEADVAADRPADRPSTDSTGSADPEPTPAPRPRPTPPQAVEEESEEAEEPDAISLDGFRRRRDSDDTEDEDEERDEPEGIRLPGRD